MERTKVAKSPRELRNPECFICKKRRPSHEMVRMDGYLVCRGHPGVSEDQKEEVKDDAGETD